MHQPPFRNFLIFVLIILAFLYGANFIVYEALLLAFDIAHPSYLVMVILGAFSISFIASMIVGRKYYNFFTRLYSWIAMAWMGFFAYLLIASVLYIAEYACIGDPSKMWAVTLFGLAILTALYGIFHARNLIVKKISISLPNIPASWRQRKAVWVSDLHIGQINGKKYVERVIKKLKNISPDIVFIGGDLFDGSAVQGILECIAPFRELSVPLGIYFIMGNHEGYGNRELFVRAIEGAGINVLDNKKEVVDGVQIVGVEYIGTTQAEDFKKVLADLSLDSAMPSILLKHEPRHMDVAEQAGISLQISGHTHKAQQWPFEYIARLVFGRFTYGFNQIGNMQTYTSSGTGTWGPPLRVGTDSEIIIFTFLNW